MVQGQVVRIVRAGETAPILGCLFDPALSFEPALRELLGSVRAAARRVFAALQSNGYGLPMQVRAWTSRVEQEILPGSEVLASCVLGPRTVMHRLNLAQGDAARLLLGAGPRLLEGQLFPL